MSIQLPPNCTLQEYTVILENESEAMCEVLTRMAQRLTKLTEQRNKLFRKSKYTARAVSDVVNALRRDTRGEQDATMADLDFAADMLEAVYHEEL